MKLITLDPEEFNEVVKRVHAFLLSRVENAKVKKDLRPTVRTETNHIETAKDVYVFVQMMDLIEHMSAEISDLREIISAVGANRQADQELGLPEMFAGKRTKFLN